MEDTRFNPVSPYAVSKLYAHETARSYRRRGFFISCGILFNHESPRRHEYFVTRKIAKGVASFASGCKDKIMLGNLDAQRDWGYAPDYCRGMHLMLQQNRPNDFVLATGKSHTVRDFCTEAFKIAGLPVTWWGRGSEEKGVLADGTTVVEVDSQYYRPNEVGRLCGDATKALKLLGWKPEVTFKDLVKIMVKEELKNV
jgi:GDPmannose 4,6-dehydratase